MAKKSAATATTGKTGHVFVGFVIFYLLAIAVQFAGKFFTDMSVNDWYLTLNKSSLTPPGYVFGIVWTALYLLMSFAAARVWARVGTFRHVAVKWWIIQLLLGLLWSISFFGHRNMLAGLEAIVLVGLSVYHCMGLFKPIDRVAYNAMVPLLLWVGFATYLNLYIVLHN